MIFILNAMMIMFGYLMELVNQHTEMTNWFPYILGCISGDPLGLYSMPTSLLP
jgi:hypothetical protein